MTLIKEMKKEMKGSEAATIKRDYLLGKIWPVLEFYDMAKQLDLEDEVVKTATEILNCMDVIVPEVHPYLRRYIEAFRAGKYAEKVYLKFFNQFLLKCDFSRDVVEVITIIITLKDALLQAVNKVYDYTENKLKALPHFRLALSNTVIVLQNVIALFGTSLVASNNLDFFHEVSSLCIRLLPRNADQVERSATGRIIQSRLFNLFFLCHMHVRIDDVFSILALVREAEIYHGYDTKVLAMCIRRQLFN
jgi:hypothetical protein